MTYEELREDSQRALKTLALGDAVEALAAEAWAWVRHLGRIHGDGRAAVAVGFAYGIVEAVLRMEDQQDLLSRIERARQLSREMFGTLIGFAMTGSHESLRPWGWQEDPK